MTDKTHEATIKCAWCHKRVTLDFHRVYTPTKEHWEGICSCGNKNYIPKPSWDKEEEDHAQQKEAASTR